MYKSLGDGLKVIRAQDGLKGYTLVSIFCNIDFACQFTQTGARDSAFNTFT